MYKKIFPFKNPTLNFIKSLYFIVSSSPTRCGDNGKQGETSFCNGKKGLDDALHFSNDVNEIPREA
jgi:hypothetical protein